MIPQNTTGQTFGAARQNIRIDERGPLPLRLQTRSTEQWRAELEDARKRARAAGRNPTANLRRGGRRHGVPVELPVTAAVEPQQAEILVASPVAVTAIDGGRRAVKMVPAAGGDGRGAAAVVEGSGRRRRGTQSSPFMHYADYDDYLGPDAAAAVIAAAAAVQGEEELGREREREWESQGQQQQVHQPQQQQQQQQSNQHQEQQQEYDLYEPDPESALNSGVEMPKKDELDGGGGAGMMLRVDSFPSPTDDELLNNDGRSHNQGNWPLNGGGGNINGNGGGGGHNGTPPTMMPGGSDGISSTNILTDKPYHSSNNNNNPYPPHKNYYLTILTSWRGEILSLFLAILALISIVVVLDHFDGRPLSDWSLTVSLNVVIAFLVMICHVSLLVPLTEGLSQLKWNWFARGERPLRDFEIFEGVSRAGGGPVGSLKFLFMRKGRCVNRSSRS